MPPDPHQGPGLPQTLEWEGVGEELARPRCWLVAVVVLAVEVARVAPQLQRVVGEVGQNVQWQEGVVVEGHLGLGEAVPGESVAVGQPPKVQGAVDQNDPCYPPQQGAGWAGSLLGMAVGVVEVALQEKTHNCWSCPFLLCSVGLSRHMERLQCI